MMSNFNSVFSEADIFPPLVLASISSKTLVNSEPIKTEIIGKRKNKVEIIKLHDFYLRLKLASIRKKLKEIPSINKCFAIDGDKYPGLIQVKRMIKALELIAEGEQEIMAKEHQIEMKEKKEKAE